MTPITIQGNDDLHIIGENISYLERKTISNPFEIQYKIIIGFGEMTSKVLSYNTEVERDTIYDGIVAQLGTVVDIT
jgi:hypothetical protein